MGGIQRFEDIRAWQEARTLIQEVYALTSSGRFSKDFGLRDQIQRAAVSVMTNIAEGFGSRSNPTFKQFLMYAQRSALEVQSLLYVSKDVQYITDEQFENLYQHVGKTSALIGALKQSLR